jgi:hypothetical protein
MKADCLRAYILHYLVIFHNVIDHNEDLSKGEE